MYDLGGKVALVTGAGGEKGFGRAIANRLAQEGAHVAVSDLTANPYGGSGWGGIDAVVAEIEANSGQAMRVLADVSDAAAVDSMVAQVIDKYGRLDILVANAGSRPGKDRVPVVELTEEAGLVFCPPAEHREPMSGLAIPFSMWQCAGHGDAAGPGFVR